MRHRTGVSVSNPHVTPSAMAGRAEAGVSAGVGTFGGVSTRLDLQLISTQAFGTGVGEERAPSSCELKLEIQRKGTAPLRIGGSFSGAPGEGRITFGIGGRF